MSEAGSTVIFGKVHFTWELHVMRPLSGAALPQDL